MNLSTSRAVPADLDALATLLATWRRGRGGDFDPASARQWLRDRLRFGEVDVLVGKCGDRVAGFALLRPDWDALTGQRSWSLQALFVDASLRRKGLARLLLQAAVELVVGDARLHALLAEDDAGTRALLEGAGWHAAPSLSCVAPRLRD